MKLLSKKNAFSLMEVLIALGIVAVLIAITLPSLYSNYQEKTLVTQLKDTYSIFSQAYTMALAEYGSMSSWTSYNCNFNVSKVCSQAVYDKLSNFLKVKHTCSESQTCFAPEQYKALDGRKIYKYQPEQFSEAKTSRGILSNGVAFSVRTFGTQCTNTSFGDIPYLNACGVITVDINGKEKPNTAGMDLFMFIMTKNGLYPAGLSNFRSPLYKCSYVSKPSEASDINGEACAGWALHRGNMDYLSKTINWEE